MLFAVMTVKIFLNIYIVPEYKEKLWHNNYRGRVCTCEVFICIEKL